MSARELANVSLPHAQQHTRRRAPSQSVVGCAPVLVALLIGAAVATVAVTQLATAAGEPQQQQQLQPSSCSRLAQSYLQLASSYPALVAELTSLGGDIAVVASSSPVDVEAVAPASLKLREALMRAELAARDLITGAATLRRLHALRSEIEQQNELANAASLQIASSPNGSSNKPQLSSRTLETLAKIGSNPSYAKLLRKVLATQRSSPVGGEATHESLEAHAGDKQTPHLQQQQQQQQRRQDSDGEFGKLIASPLNAAELSATRLASRDSLDKLRALNSPQVRHPAHLPSGDDPRG